MAKVCRNRLRVWFSKPHKQLEIYEGKTCVSGIGKDWLAREAAEGFA